jgi:hypothetical protein
VGSAEIPQGKPVVGMPGCIYENDIGNYYFKLFLFYDKTEMVLKKTITGKKVLSAADTGYL